MSTNSFVENSGVKTQARAKFGLNANVCPLSANCRHIQAGFAIESVRRFEVRDEDSYNLQGAGIEVIPNGTEVLL